MVDTLLNDEVPQQHKFEYSAPDQPGTNGSPSNFVGNTRIGDIAWEGSLLKGVVSFHHPQGWKTIPLEEIAGWGRAAGPLSFPLVR